MTHKLTKVFLSSAIVLMSIVAINAQTKDASQTSTGEWQYSFYLDGFDSLRVNRAMLHTRHDLDETETPSTRGWMYIFKHFEKEDGKKKKDSDGWSVTFKSEESSVWCYKICMIKYRIDDLRTQSFLGNMGGTTGNRMIYVGDARKFIEKLKGAATLEVQLPLLNDRTRLYRFDVSQLDTEKLLERYP